LEEFWIFQKYYPVGGNGIRGFSEERGEGRDGERNNTVFV